MALNASYGLNPSPYTEARAEVARLTAENAELKRKLDEARQANADAGTHEHQDGPICRSGSCGRWWNERAGCAAGSVDPLDAELLAHGQVQPR